TAARVCAMWVWVAIRGTIAITITIVAVAVWVSETSGATALRHLNNGSCALQWRHRHLGVGSVCYQQCSCHQNKPDRTILENAHQSSSLVFDLVLTPRHCCMRQPAHQALRKSSGSFAILAAMRRAQKKREPASVISGCTFVAAREHLQRSYLQVFCPTAWH